MFKPLSNYILISPIELPDTTPSGLLLPENSKERPNQGKVIATGNGQRSDNGELIPLNVSVNDVVFFPKYSGMEIKLDGERYLILRDTELLGILIGDN